MKGSGIEDILVESRVCLRGPANKVIAGKDYYKMVHHHSLVSEAMMGLLWTSFEEYLRNHGQSYATEGIEQLIFQLFQALKEKGCKQGTSDEKGGKGRTSKNTANVGPVYRKKHQ